MSDEELEDDCEGEKENNVVAIIAHVRSKSIVHNDGESSDEDLSDENVVEAYKFLYLKWKEKFLSGDKHRVKINILLQNKTNLIQLSLSYKKKLTTSTPNLKI